MKIGICDDTKEFCEQLKSIVEEFCEEEKMNAQIALYYSGTQFLEDSVPCDILFLDIELGDTTGIEILKKLKQAHSGTLVLVVTSYAGYIDDAMDYDILRYINKPFEKPRIAAALKKARSVLDNEYIVVNDLKTKSMQKIAMRDIIYAETKLRKIYLYTKDQTYILREGFKDLKNRLTASFFAEPHYSFIINMNFIKCFKRTEIILDVCGKDRVFNVSSDKQHKLRKQYTHFLGEDYDG